GGPAAGGRDLARGQRRPGHDFYTECIETRGPPDPCPRTWWRRGGSPATPPLPGSAASPPGGRRAAPDRTGPVRPRLRSAPSRRRTEPRRPATAAEAAGLVVRESAAPPRAGMPRPARGSSLPSAELLHLLHERRERDLLLRARLQLLQARAPGLQLRVSEHHGESRAERVRPLELVARIRLAKAHFRGKPRCPKLLRQLV